MNRSIVSRLRGRNNEGVLAAIIILLVIAMSIANPDFFSASTLFAIVRNNLVQLVFAIGVLLVIISGGIDVSFTAIAILAGYTAVKIAQGGSPLDLVACIVAVALVIGGVLGAGNGLIISKFRLPTLIVTLGTQGIYRGVLLAYIGSKYIADLPEQLDALSTTSLISAERDGVTTKLHIFILPVIVIAILAAYLLNRTMFGRGLYAMGGDVESARRAGVPVARYQIMAYSLVGVLAGVAGIMHVTLSRNAKPQDLVGTELDVIAAVVLGGAAITGGRGSVTGTVLGVLLIGVINNSLIMLGVPGTWQRAAVGILLIGGLAVQAIGSRRRTRRDATTLDAIGEIA